MCARATVDAHTIVCVRFGEDTQSHSYSMHVTVALCMWHAGPNSRRLTMCALTSVCIAIGSRSAQSVAELVQRCKEQRMCYSCAQLYVSQCEL